MFGQDKKGAGGSSGEIMAGDWEKGAQVIERSGDQVIDGQVFRWKRGQVFKKKVHRWETQTRQSPAGASHLSSRECWRGPVPLSGTRTQQIGAKVTRLEMIKKQICQLVPSLHFEGDVFLKKTCIWAWRPMSMICSAGTKSVIIESSNLYKSRSMDYYYWRRRARFPGKEYLNRNGEDVMSLMQ